MVTPENPKTLCTPRSMRLLARISALFIIVPRSVSPPYQRKSMSTGRSNSFLILSAHFFIRWPRSRCFQSIFTHSQVPRLAACLSISHIQPNPIFPQPFLPGAPVQRPTTFLPHPPQSFILPHPDNLSPCFGWNRCGCSLFFRRGHAGEGLSRWGNFYIFES